MLENLQKYKDAASYVPGSVVIFQWSTEGRMILLYYSENARLLTGMTEQEISDITAANALDLILEDDHRVISEKINIAVRNKTELDIIYRQHHHTRGIVWVHMKAMVVDHADGMPVFMATMLDVTGEMLNSSAIMEATDRCICMIEKHSKLLLYANTRFYDLIQLDPSRSLGIHCYEALCGNPAFRSDDNCLCFSTINIEKPLEYYNPDSKKYLSMYGREIMWGEHEAYVFYLSDLTEEKRVETLLKNAQERFEMTLDNTNLFIWEYDMVNNLCINPDKAVREYGLPKIIENYPETLYEMGHTPPETVEQIKEAKRRLFNGETGFSMIRKTINSNGDAQWMKVDYTLEKDKDGKPIRALVCGTDITEQKQKEAHYEEELQRKTTVAADTKIVAILDLTADFVSECSSDNAELRKLLLSGSVNEVSNAVCKHFVLESDQSACLARFNREKMLADYQNGVLHGSLRHQFLHTLG